jgi:hypothetical protein
MFLNTARIPWAVLRGAVTVDDTPLASFDYGDWPASGVVKLSEPPLADANGVVIAFHGTDAADEIANYKLYGRCRCNGPIQLLLAGVVTLGTLAATTDPVDNVTPIANGLWADTITVTGGLFSSLDIVTISDSGNNRICELSFDQRHIEDLRLEIDIPAASQVASIYGIISGY